MSMVWTLWMVVSFGGVPQAVPIATNFSTEQACDTALQHVEREMAKAYPDTALPTYYCAPKTHS
mgnify:CR=1 FL=1